MSSLVLLSISVDIASLILTSIESSPSRALLWKDIVNYLDLTEYKSLSYPNFSKIAHIAASPSDNNSFFHQSLKPLRVNSPS